MDFTQHTTNAAQTREQRKTFEAFWEKPLRTQQMAVVKSPTVGVEAFLQSSGKRRFRRQ